MSDPRLQHIPNLWSANSLVRLAASGVPTGFPELDRAIGAWPTPALVEFLIDEYGIGELQLLIPLIRELQRHDETSAARIVLWLNSPFEIHATALLQYQLKPELHWTTQASNDVDAMWAAEHALRSGACSLVIAWLGRVDLKSLRRLKLAALTGTSCVIFRPCSEKSASSPATLRMVLAPHSAGLSVNIIKLSGKRPRELVIEVDQRIATANGESPS
jgi:protein ImuA